MNASRAIACLRVRNNWRAVTLIELMVSIGVIAVLVSLLLVSLRGTKLAARQAQSTSDLHQAMVGLGVYLGEFKDLYPFFGTPGRPDAAIEIRGISLTPSQFGLSFFRAHSQHWANLLVPGFVEDRRLFESPGTLKAASTVSLPRELFLSRILLSHTAQARPVYFQDSAGPLEPAWVVGSGAWLVTFPESKGLLVDVGKGPLADTDGPRGPTHSTVAMVGGSAGVRPWTHTPPDPPVVRPYGSMTWPVMATQKGFEGRDYP